jgi:hypothetical protein
MPRCKCAHAQGRVALFIASRAKERVSDSVSKEEVHARTGVCAVCV